ncbi:cyclophilin-like family protein [Natronobiforma cellulositropha]|uniref:cyclophilin-like family protein n=1 Tax=Natronobiforma cellulositropha TaxID=1679076 RepID=UPI0021D5AFBB|nr:cyclophilin-like family protein [Natronobiforma cellulositropha]
MADLIISVDDVRLEATFTDDAPETRAALEAALPLSGDAARWGDELYFSTPVDVGLENARTEVPVGALAYWPAGNALCLFWGPTPASHGDEPRAASPVNLVALVEDTTALASLEGAGRLTLERADTPRDDGDT